LTRLVQVARRGDPTPIVIELAPDGLTLGNGSSFSNPNRPAYPATWPIRMLLSLQSCDLQKASSPRKQLPAIVGLLRGNQLLFLHAQASSPK